jgi:hypothetical protein
MDGEIYLGIPSGALTGLSERKTTVCHINKSLYGLERA